VQRVSLLFAERGHTTGLVRLLPAALSTRLQYCVQYCKIACALCAPDVMVAAIRSDTGASRHLLVAGLRRRLTMLVSVPLVFEYEAVMTRPEHLAAARLSTADVTVLLDAVVAVAEPVRLAYLWRPQLRDADDDMVLEAAINGRADRLVTFNQQHFTAASASFGLVICTPRVAVLALEAGS
jgi:predicted nucleic acid-binding protein